MKILKTSTKPAGRMTNSVLAGGLIRYTCFPEDVVAFTTTRSVARDYRRIAALINIPEERIVAPHQSHSTRVVEIDDGLLSAPELVRKERLEGVDAVYTNISDVCIGVSTADCVPVLLCDRYGERVVAAIHAGWRGTVGRIAQHTIEVMTDAYNIKPETLFAVIGPAISFERFEVGDEVYDEFSRAGFDMNGIAKRRGKWFIDLKECNRRQLVECGIRSENIFVEPLSTYDEPELLFSARREQRGGVKCGRNFSGIVRLRHGGRSLS
ncbi:MAG: peptidoglycan editing factor PgeF [Prevotella sp.]|nr:peptidoglycan editing factor PgeF [Prevotella sp.]